MFYVIVDQKTAHIAKLKSKEKTKTKKNRRMAGTKKMFFAGDAVICYLISRASISGTSTSLERTWLIATH